MTNDPTLLDASAFPRLVVMMEGKVVQEAILEEELSIGRAEDNDLVLADPKVSRHHAQVHREETSFILTDLDSANGTLVQGGYLTEPYTLQNGDKIQIGDVALSYYEAGRSSEDTIIAPTPVAQPDPVARHVPPPPVPAATPVTQSQDRTGLTIGLVAAAVLALGAIVVVSTYLLVPGFFGPVQPTPVPTQTPQVVVATDTLAPDASPTAAALPSQEAATTEASGEATNELDELLVQADALSRRSKFEDSIAIYEDLVERAPNDVRPEVGWAWALLWDERADEALEHAQRAVNLDPTSVEAVAVLGRVYIALGEEDQALDAGQEAVELDPGSAIAHAVLAEAYLINGQTQDAVDAADVALVQDINNANAHRIRGWIYHVVDNDMGRAAGELQIAAGLQPELWLRRHELGELLLAAEDYTTSIMAFQDALGLRPKAVTYSAIGEAYYRLGQYDQAKASLDLALDAGATDLNTYALAGVTYAQLGRCDEAQSYYEQVLEEDSRDPLASEAEDLCEGERPSATPSPTTASASAPTASATPEPTARSTRSPAAVSGRIAFPVWNQETGHYDTYVAQAADGSGRQLVVSEMRQPAFNPDGDWLAVNGERDEHMNLFIVEPDGSNLKEITSYIEDGLPSWSPDGASLVFSSTRHGDKQSRIYIIDEVPFVGGREDGRALNFGPDDVRGEYPAWAGEDQVVFKGCDLTVEPAQCGLYIMSSAPGPQPMTQLTENPEDTAPAVYEDRIAFMSNRDGNWEIYVMDIDGSGVERLTDNAAHDGLPVWSPDGRTLAFVSDQGGAWAVWAMSPDGSNRRILFEIGNGGLAFNWQQERISWAP
ncbi:MAG: FHA domain-containing protein [Anaerolineae bacterium]|jgi:beta propeller repeat protein